MKDSIYRSISFIESRLADELTIDELAGQSFFSKTHYQRLFREIVGEPVMEYIKKRRLQQAGQSLLACRDSVLEIALRYGYDSHEGFSRAFKAYFGVSPVKFRKGIILKEEFRMLSKELLGSIKSRKTEIAEVLQPLAAEFEALAKDAESTAKAVGVPGTTTLILAGEYNNLASRISAVVGRLTEGLAGESVVEVTDSLYTFTKQIDDFAFQTNILRFLSAIETARIGEHKEPFMKIDSRLDDLMHGLMSNRTSVVKMLDELMQLIRTEIEKDAAGYLRNIDDLLRKAVAEGVSVAAEAKSAALSLGENGGAYMRIASELEKRVEILKTLADEPNGEAFKHLINVAFHTNLNAFNARVETARSADRAELVKCTERLLAYPQTLNKAYDSCTELWGEYVKLNGLLERPVTPLENKIMEDVLFQADLLGLQLGMEVARARRHEDLAQEFEKAHAELIGSAQDIAALGRYHEALSACTTKLLDGAEHSFLVIAEEYKELAARIAVVLNRSLTPTG